MDEIVKYIKKNLMHLFMSGSGNNFVTVFGIETDNDLGALILGLINSLRQFVIFQNRVSGVWFIQDFED